jgi:hypothetical protein
MSRSRSTLDVSMSTILMRRTTSEVVQWSPWRPGSPARAWTPPEWKTPRNGYGRSRIRRPMTSSSSHSSTTSSTTLSCRSPVLLSHHPGRRRSDVSTESSTTPSVRRARSDDARVPGASVVRFDPLFYAGVITSRVCERDRVRSIDGVAQAREGEAVCRISPVGGGRAAKSTIGDFLRLREELPPVDDAYGKTVLELTRKQGKTPRSPWES